jgi:PPOX class probable F420-dependent enzyme
VRHNLSIEELGDLLELPIVSTLATYRRAGTVLLSPVWHEWDDGGVVVCAGANDVKVRHLRRDPRASLVLYDQQPPYRGLEIRGTAVLSTRADYRAIERRIAVRYLGERLGNAYSEASTASGVVIRIRRADAELRTWDFADDPTTGTIG